MASVLVTYASAHGSTRGIAEHVAARLLASGHAVVLRPVDLVDGLAEYDAVVLGSPVYDQEWLPEADEFAAGHRTELAGVPLWLFSVGSFGDRRRLIGRLMTKEPRNIGELRQSLRPRDYRVFAGVIERHQWPFLSRQLFHLFGGRLGDSRDWPDIDRWADAIARELSDPRDETAGAQRARPGPRLDTRGETQL